VPQPCPHGCPWLSNCWSKRAIATRYRTVG